MIDRSLWMPSGGLFSQSSLQWLGFELFLTSLVVDGDKIASSLSSGVAEERVALSMQASAVLAVRCSPKSFTA